MKYMLLIQAGAEGTTDGAAADPGCEVAEWIAYTEAVRDAGIYVSGEALADLVTATTVRVDAAGGRSVTDGPFAESREVLGGFYVIDVPDLDTALDWAARCPGARGDGAVVVRPVAGDGDFGD
ncbi:YciI family protein [Streptomyces sp. LE64]|uniref:YciI family protein n=1 Tax=unclassified Streptomyces TaxID=2593676 RepID=UPI003323C4E0